MFKRIFWLAIGLGLGFGMSFWLMRFLRETVDRYRPERVSQDLAGALSKLGDDLRVVVRLGDCRDAGRVPCSGAQERGPAHVDQLDRLIDAEVASPDFGCERSNVDDDEVDGADALLAKLVELGLDIAPREDPRVHRRVERLQLAADQWRYLGQVRDGQDLDAFGRKVLAGAVGRVDLDAELTQLAGESADPSPVGD